jgi:hypothetical protein
MQINNLKIKFNKASGKWQVIAPDKRILEEYTDKGLACMFCNITRDFVKRK